MRVTEVAMRGSLHQHYLGVVYQVYETESGTVTCFELVARESLTQPQLDVQEMKTFSFDYLNIQTLPGDSKRRESLFIKGQWYELQIDHQPIGSSREAAVPQTIEPTPLPQDARLSEPPRLIDGRSRKGKLLRKVFSLDFAEDAKKRDILRALSLGESPAMVTCYDVGQGNANALCDKYGKPLVYFDFGGGYRTHALTYPQNLRFCLSTQQPVVLSHWDGDHWISGDKDRRALRSVWIVPRQTGISPAGIKFAKLLAKKKKLLVWPSGLSRLAVGWGTLVKLPPHQDTNQSGLALFVKTIVPGDAGGPPQETLTLLPGDANYNRIRRVYPFSKLDGLVATHHGAAFQMGHAPQANIGGSKVAIPVGCPNQYKHPGPAAMVRYMHGGWTRQLCSPRGHIMVVPQHGAPPKLPCRRRCTLQLRQF